MAHAITLPKFDASALTKLARNAGLKIDEADLEQLVRRRIVTPLDDMFVAPHLFVLAIYIDSVRVIRHPWGPKSGDLGLKDVRQVNDRLMKVLEEGVAEDTAAFVVEMERYLAGLDPFGPFAGVVDMLGDDAAESFRGAGRLYVELRRVARTLAEKAEEAGLDSPATRELSLEAEVNDDPRATADLSQADVLAGLHPKDVPPSDDEAEDEESLVSADGADGADGADEADQADEESDVLEAGASDEKDEDVSDLSEVEADKEDSDVSKASASDEAHEQVSEVEADEEESDFSETGTADQADQADQADEEESDFSETGTADQADQADRADEDLSEAEADEQLSNASDAEADEEDSEQRDGDGEDPEAGATEFEVEENDKESEAREAAQDSDPERPDPAVSDPDKSKAQSDEKASDADEEPAETEHDGDANELKDAATGTAIPVAEPTVVLEEPSSGLDSVESVSDAPLEAADEESDGDDEPIPGPMVDPEELISTTEMDAVNRPEDDHPAGLDEATAGSDAEADELAAAEADLDPHDRQTPVAPLEAARPDEEKRQDGESLRERLARLRKDSEEEPSEESEANHEGESSQGGSQAQTKTPSQTAATDPKTPGPPTPPPTREVPEADADDTDDEGDSPEVIARKVTELNRLREQYIADKNWEGLAELYEDRIGLFETPAERQQIYLTLATVYDVKLDRAQDAMNSYTAAIDEGASDGMKRALSGLNKVGKRDGNRADYLEWLERAIDSPKLRAHRPTLRRRLAVVLGLEGDTTRAFMTLAAAMTSHPERLIDVDALDTLDEWAAISELEDELDAFFDDIIDEEMPDAARRLVAQRAGLHHIAKSQPMRAIRFFRIVLQIQPDNEMAFGNLSRLYQDEDNYTDLVRLIEAKLAATEDPDEIERLQNELANAVDEELAQDDAIEFYERMLENSPDNPVVADRLVRAHLMREQHAQAYGLLNRFVETAQTPDQQVNVHLRLAEIAANHLHAPEEALVHYEEALAVDSDPRALQGIAHLKFEAEDWEGVVEAIEALIDSDESLHFEERIAWLEKGIAAAEKTANDAAMEKFIAGMNQFDV